jgi:hypothetical protein
MSLANASRGFTLIEAAALTAAAAAMGSLGLIAFGGQPQAARDGARQRKDMTQIRGIHQALVVWAQNNNDLYPMPSKLDVENHTVREEGRAKDTSANIYSMLVYQGSIGTEMLVSPVENNDAVTASQTYEFDQPRAAVNPAKAIWDPQLKVGLGERGTEKGHVSYAHLQPAGGRLSAWSNSFNAREVALSNRGPEITKVVVDDSDIAVPTLAKPDSKAMNQLGDGEVWNGHIVTNDNHVEFVRRLFAHERFYKRGDINYTNRDGFNVTDVIFFDEQDDPKSKNMFLGLFIKAGEKPADYKPIWD